MRTFFKLASFTVLLVVVSASANAGVVIGGHHDIDDKVFVGVPAVPAAGTLSLTAVGLGLIGLRLRRKQK